MTNLPFNAKNGATTQFRLQRPATALGLLGCMFLFCLVISGVLLPFIPRLVSRPEAAIKITVVIQDFLVFIVPAVATAVIVTRLPARLLCVDKWPKPGVALLACGVLICSIPAMNAIIEWNKNWHLPESMSSAEVFFRQLEDGAEATTRMLMNGASIPSLIVSVLIVGVLAGFSEELFFRGALQRILGQTSLNIHLTIWLVAFIFSAFHFQLFGLVPRMLLGAFFGYLLWWSKSLWLPILLHILNNSIVVIASYFDAQNADDTASGQTGIDNIGANLSSSSDIILVIASVIFTTVGIFLIHRYYTSNRKHG